MAQKVEEYLAAGFDQVWVVHPNTRTVIVRRADGSARLYRADDEITAEPALASFRCQVAEFFH